MLRCPLRECALHKTLHQPCRYRDTESVDHHAVDSDEPPLRVNERAAGIAWGEPDICDNPAWGFRPVAGDGMEYAHSQRIANSERVSVREYELSGSERFRIA